MDISLEQPLFLLSVPVIVLIAWLSYRKCSEYFTAWNTSCLLLAGCLLSISASAPTITWPGLPAHTVFLVDLSDSTSISASELQRYLKSIRTRRESPGDLSVLLFGKNSEWLFKREPALPDVTGEQISAARERVDGSASNPADAMDTVLSVARPDEQLIPILVSDGQFPDEQRSNLRQIAQRREVPVHAIPSRSHAWKDVWIDHVSSPSFIRTGDAFQLEVRLRATGSFQGRIRVTRPGEQTEIVSAPFSIRKQQSRTVRMNVDSSQKPFQRYRITVSVTGDEWTRRNNVVTTGVRASKTFNVLWTGPGDLFKQLSPALNEKHIRIEHENEPVRTEPFDLFLLSGHADQTTEQWRNRLSRSVRHRGAGLIMIGGDDSFARGGWSGTEVEEVLPVRVFPPDHLSLSFLLDVSGSMSDPVDQAGSGRRKLHIVQDAVLDALTLLKPGDRLELRSFSDTTELLRPLEKLGRTHQLGDTVQRLAAGGDTRLLPALRASVRSLSETPPENRYLFVFTDGQLSGDLEAFRSVSDRAAGARIRFIVLTTGDQADRERLRALTGGGTFGRVLSLDSMGSLQNRLLGELERIRAFVRQAESATVRPSKTLNSLLSIPHENLPELTGPYYRVSERSFARTVLRSKTYDEPLVSAWQPGQGRSMALTVLFNKLDARSRATQNAWIRTLRRSIEWALPSRPSNWSLRSDLSRNHLTVYAQRNTSSFDIRSLQASGVLKQGDDQQRSMTVTPLSRTQLRFRTQRPEAGSYQFTGSVSHDKNDVQLSIPVDVPVEREYLHPSPNRRFLKKLAAGTGGQRLQAQSAARRSELRKIGTGKQRIPAGRYTMMLAGLCLLLLLVRF